MLLVGGVGVRSACGRGGVRSACGERGGGECLWEGWE